MKEDTSMGESQEHLAMAIQKLAEILSSKTGEGGGMLSNVSVTQAETVQRIELMPNDIKLEGVKNYLSWSRRALLILRTKDLDGCVLGKVSEPEDKASVEWKKLSITNSLVVAWLLNSLIPTIAASVDTLSKADEVWNTLSKLYSGKGNIMLMAQIEEKVIDLKQGDKTVMEYVTEIQHLWADLDHCDHLRSLMLKVLYKCING